MSMSMSELLPQRYPFLMIDAVTEHRPGFLRAQKRITANDGCFEGEAVYKLPNVFLLEMMAQAGAALARLDRPTEKGGVLVPGKIAAIRRARFYRSVGPGDTVSIDVVAIQRVGQLSIARARVLNDERLAAWGDLVLVSPAR